MDKLNVRVAVWAYRRGLKEAIDTLVDKMANLPDVVLEEGFSKVTIQSPPESNDKPQT